MDANHDVDVEYDEHAVHITPPAREAAEVKAVLVSLQRGLASMGAACRFTRSDTHSQRV